MIEIKDFPEGTKLNILYTAPISDYFNHKLPPVFISINNRVVWSKFGIQVYNLSLNAPLFIDKIDFSDVEKLYWSEENNPTIPSSDFVLNLPKIKIAEFSMNLSSKIKTITLNCGDDLESIYSSPKFYNSTSWGIFTLNSNSKNIKTISNIDPDNLYASEFKINCDCERLTTSPYVRTYSQIKNVTYHSGFPNCKYSTNDAYYYVKLPNLTYESCISILNNLYDFTGNGVTPNSSQGQLKVHSNFLSLVGDEISIGTNKGWTITA